jgi:hypothetical protein
VEADILLNRRIVDAQSVMVGNAFTVALASLTTRYGEYRSVIDEFANRNSHLSSHRFSNDSDEDLRAFADDFIDVLIEVGILESRF